MGDLLRQAGQDSGFWEKRIDRLTHLARRYANCTTTAGSLDLTKAVTFVRKSGSPEPCPRAGQIPREKRE